MRRATVPRAAIPAAVALWAALLVPGLAPAAVGEITPLGCIDDNDTGADTCVQATDGLDGANTIAVSPDGTSVYAASFGDDALVRFDRDPVTGTLIPAGCVDDNDTGLDGCTQSTDGLDGPAEGTSVAVSPDGRSVYAVGRLDDALVRFNRDPATGAITPLGCIDDNDPPEGPDTCAQSTDGLNDANAVAVSPDGRSVYVTSASDYAVVRFDRDPNSGALTPQGCVSDNDVATDTCAQSTNGLEGANGVAVSPDGTSVYAASFGDDALVRFARDPTTGAITPQGCVDDNDPPSGADVCAQSADGLSFANAVTVSPDGRSVYVASVSDDAVARFDRDPTTGALTPQGCVEDNDPPDGPDACAQGADGLAGAQVVAVSSDGRSVYVASDDNDAVVRLDRDPATGALAPQGCVDDNDPGDGLDACAQSTDGLAFAKSVAVSADERSVYVAAATDDAVVLFAREPDPPETRIKGRRRTAKLRPRFRLRSDEPGSTFECKLDKRRWKACRSRYRTTRLDPGRHVLKARATDPGGNTDPTPAKKRFRIVD